jgi:hypothetical protein
MLEVKFYRPFRALQNGGLVSMNLRIGVTNTGVLLVPAHALGISDNAAMAFRGNPARPVLIEDGTVYIDIEHAIDFLPQPAAKECLRLVQENVLKRLWR